MSAIEMIRLIVVREVRERALRKGYLVGTIATLAVVAAAIVVPSLFGDDDASLGLGVVGDAPATLAEQIEPALGEDESVEITELAGVEEGEQALADGDVDAVLVERRELLVEGMPHLGLQAALNAALREEAMLSGLAELGVDEQSAVAAMQPPPPLEVVDPTTDADDGTDGVGAGGEAFLVALIATVLLVVGVQMAGATLLTSALEEKSNRVVEVLVATARPWQLLTGKVLATSLLTFVQIVLVVAVALGANEAVGAFELPAATGSVLGVSALMLVAGFLFYAAMFTVAGTLSATVEDSQSAAGPLYIAMWGTYGAVIAIVLPDPSSLLAQVLTYLPPTAPFVVPARMALGEMAIWELVLAVVLTLAGSVLMLRLAGRLYAASLLSGGKLTWAKAFKAEPVR